MSMACIHDAPASADLIYACKVDHGSDTASETDLRERLTPQIRKTRPYVWVGPDLLPEIEYRAKSAGQGAPPVLQGSAGDL